jgi:CBS-domain-containing membrane protein
LSAVTGREAWISGVGGFLGIFLVMLIAAAWLGGPGAIFTVSSMGGTALLLFGMPHAPAAQPWPVAGGHLVSAAVALLVMRWLGHDTALAAALAVGAAILAMYLLRCLHPPGGATALYTLMNGEAVSALGWGYLTGPVLLSVLILLITAVAWNYPFRWRRYPQAWFNRGAGAQPAERMIPHSRLVYALSQLDTYMDISEQDLLRIYALATQPVADEHAPG